PLSTLCLVAFSLHDALPILVALACLAGAAQAQQVQEYSFPSHDGSKSPPSTLRITEQPGAGAAPSGVIRDTPESLEQYQRCRNKDRKSTRLNSSHVKISYAV